MNVETSFVIQGGKTGVLLLHDLGASAVELRPLAQQLAMNGYTVVLPQLGARSSTSSSQVTASALIGEAEAGLAKLKERCSDIVVFGVAYGAMLALEVARQNKATVQAIVAIEPRAWLPGLRLPFADRLSGHLHIRQAWIAQLVGLIGTVSTQISGRFSGAATALGANQRPAQMLGLAEAQQGFQPDRMLHGAGQLLDCLHATLPEIRQPVLVIRNPKAPAAVIDSSILLQRRLGGRVETAVLDEAQNADVKFEARLTQDGQELQNQDAVAERGVRFLAAVLDELTTRRDNELRRQKMGAGRPNAA